MDAAATIRVRKRDGTVEEFSRRKLAGAMYRAMQPFSGRPSDADSLAGAVQACLRRSRAACVSGAAVFEMALKVLRRVRFHEAADAMEAHRAWRQAHRGRVRILHHGGRVTAWEKAWLAGLAERGWHLSRCVARIIAGQIEQDLFSRGAPRAASSAAGARPSVLTRAAALEMLNRRVAALGLADAVPVNRPTVE